MSEWRLVIRSDDADEDDDEEDDDDNSDDSEKIIMTIIVIILTIMLVMSLLAKFTQIDQLTTAQGDRDHDRQWEKKQKAPHGDPRPGKVSQNI